MQWTHVQTSHSQGVSMVPKSISYIYNDRTMASAGLGVVVVYTDTFGPLWDVTAYWDDGDVDTFTLPFGSVLNDWDTLNKQKVSFYVVDNWE